MTAEATGVIPPETIQGARQGRVWPLLWVKEALAGESVAEAFDAYRRLLDRPADEHLTEKCVASLRDFAGVHGVAFNETERAGDAFVNEPPRVIGAGNHRVLRNTARSMFVACLRDVRVRGRSAVIEAGDLALLDYQGDELARIDETLEIDPAVFRSNHETVWVIEPGRGPAMQLDEAFHMLGPNTWAFGHWMAENLPKYMLAVRSGLPAVPVLVDAGMPASHRQALDLLIPEGASLVEVPSQAAVRVSRLWCAPTPGYCPLLEKVNDKYCDDYLAAPPERYAAAIREMNRLIDTSPFTAVPGPKRVFLARKPHLQRRLVNHETIEAIARQHGYMVTYPEELDFAGQVNLLRSARNVVGPEGSALFLAFFARPGARLCVLNHPHTVLLTCVTALLAGIGIDVSVLTGPYVREHTEYPHFSDYAIDEAAFDGFLRSWA